MQLRFPDDRIVGQLDWAAAPPPDRPVLATGVVEVPADAELVLTVSALVGVESRGDGQWALIGEAAGIPIDLDFLRELPPDSINSLSLRRSGYESFAALSHLAPGLRKLYLGWTGLDDEILPHVATLTNLTYLQTFGNHFTDQGVQQLAALQRLESLYLEEESLTITAFDFAARLPSLARLGLQDVPLRPPELAELRSRLPGVRVG